jgi:hypothetical protein
MIFDQNELDVLQEILGAHLLDFPEDAEAAAIFERVNEELA